MPKRWLTACLVSLAASACQESQRPDEHPGSSDGDAPLRVVVTNEPLRFFARAIGGERVSATLPVPADLDPAFWRPDADAVLIMQEADLVLRNGAGHEPWWGQVSLPATRCVNTTAGLTERLLTLPDSVTHSHGPEGAHSHSGIAFTTWLDPPMAKAQARAVCDALAARRPHWSAEFETGFAALARRLDDLDAALLAAVTDRHDTPLLASHPVYQYLARSLALNLVSVHWEPDAMPTEDEWRALQRTLEEHPARWMMWEAEPEVAIARRLEDLGVGSFVFSPCGNTPARGDYLTVQEQNAARLATAFAGE